MGNEVILLYRDQLGASELNLIKIVKFLGGSIRAVGLTPELVRDVDHLKSAVPVDGCVITSAHTLASLWDQQRNGASWPQFLLRSAANLLVFGFEPARSHGQLLRALTTDSLLGVEAVNAGNPTVTVAHDARGVCRQFTGLRFEAPGFAAGFTFAEAEGQSRCAPLASFGQGPFFVRLSDQSRQRLLLAGTQIADLDAEVPRGTSPLRFFPSLVPVLMFLKACTNIQLWHNDAPRACFILDDPPLKRRYGFLDYEKLLDVMGRKQFCTSIAFIPWNFGRSDQGVSSLFANSQNRYSLCVHGCDHTAGEFGSTDPRLLREKAQMALDRMRRHQHLSGLDFDPVMVFPQGIFSTTAMGALKACNYLAAVNSTAYPVDGGNRIILGDLLEVALTRYSNFPLFTRRSAENLEELAFDLFLGKPALVVEHHGFFRKGYEAVGETVDKLSRLDERLQWANLATACSHACSKRVVANGDVHVRFFTDRFSLRNDTERPQNYVLFRPTFGREPARRANVNGHPVETVQEADAFRVQLSLSVGQAVELRIEDADRTPLETPRRLRPMYRARVFIRRSLSEFRDNYLDKHPLLSKSARNLLARRRTEYSETTGGAVGTDGGRLRHQKPTPLTP